MSWSIGHLAASARWLHFDDAQNDRAGYASDPEVGKARLAVRDKYLRSLKPVFQFASLPVKLQLHHIEFLDYDDLKCCE